MIFLAMMLAAAGPAPMQVLEGAAFENFAKRTDAICPTRDVRLITPGDLDFVQAGFEEQLSHEDQARLQSANTAGSRCAGRNGLSCPTTATLEAMEKTKLTSKFITYICTHPNSR